MQQPSACRIAPPGSTREIPLSRTITKHKSPKRHTAFVDWSKRGFNEESARGLGESMMRAITKLPVQGFVSI
jgi:hypothetical protein